LEKNLKAINRIKHNLPLIYILFILSKDQDGSTFFGASDKKFWCFCVLKQL
jgi:hypothetical protein